LERRLLAACRFDRNTQCFEGRAPASLPRLALRLFETPRVIEILITLDSLTAFKLRFELALHQRIDGYVVQSF
jgi:hypothetical protein